MSAPETPEQQMPTPIRVTMRSRRRRNRMLFNRQQRRARVSESGDGPVLPDWFRAIRDSIRKRDMEGILLILARSGSDLLRNEVNGSSIVDILTTNGEFALANSLLEKRILTVNDVMKMVKKYISLDMSMAGVKQLIDTFGLLGDDRVSLIMSQKLPVVFDELVEKIEDFELNESTIRVLTGLIEIALKSISMNTRRVLLQKLEAVRGIGVDLEQIETYLHERYLINTMYSIDRFLLINLNDPKNRLLLLNDPAKDASSNCSFMGNRGDREGPVKIRVTTTPTISLNAWQRVIGEPSYRLSYKGEKIDNGTKVYVTYKKNDMKYTKKAKTYDSGETKSFRIVNDIPEMITLNTFSVKLDVDVIPIEFKVDSSEWATEDGRILHVFCGKDLQKYLKSNNKSPFDRREIVGVQFLTTKEIKEQERLMIRQMRSKINMDLLKTPEKKPKESPKMDPVDVLQKRLNVKFNMQDSMLLQRIKNMRNLLKNPKLNKENEELYKEKLKEYESQISDPQDALIKRKEKERDNLLIQQLETREKIREYQAGKLQWTESQANYYQDLLNSFPRMIERLDNEIENIKNSRDGASKLKKPRLKKIKF